MRFVVAQVVGALVVVVVFGGFLAGNHWDAAACIDDLRRWSRALSEWSARHVWES